MNRDEIISKYYTPKILLGKKIIDDIVDEMYNKNKSVLIFGLGYDSNLYYHANNGKNIWFVESNDEYINLCKEIDRKCVIKHDYNGITVKSSFNLTMDQIEKYPVPYQLIKNAPYDIILIDAPVGSHDGAPGRLLPVFWTSEFLAHTGSLVYIDDTDRPLEKYCVNKFFSGYTQKMRDVANAETLKFVV